MARTPGADARLMTRLRAADPAPLPPMGNLDERAEADLAAILATQTAFSPAPRRRPLVLVAAAVVVTLGVGAVVTGVVQRDDDGARGGPATALADAPGGMAAPLASTAAARAPDPDAETLLALGGLIAYDDPPAETPSELAGGADLVAIGSLAGAVTDEPGGVCGGAVPGVRGERVRLDDLSVVKGAPAAEPIVVAVPLEGLDALSRGTWVLVFAALDSASDCSPAYVTAPQGLAVQAAGRQVVWPLLGEVRDGDVSQALPGGTLIAP